MQETLHPNKHQLLTLKLFAEKNPWPGESTLRYLYYNRNKNGLARAFLKIGRRIIVNEEIFFSLIKKIKVNKDAKC